MDTPHWAGQLFERMDKFESLLSDLIQQRTAKEWYTTHEIAKILGKRPFTVREWCRLGRVHGEKMESRRGKHENWRISHEELLRYQREGLLPFEKISTVVDKDNLC